METSDEWCGHQIWQHLPNQVFMGHSREVCFYARSCTDKYQRTDDSYQNGMSKAFARVLPTICGINVWLSSHHNIKGGCSAQYIAFSSCLQIVYRCFQGIGSCREPWSAMFWSNMTHKEKASKAYRSSQEAHCLVRNINIFNLASYYMCLEKSLRKLLIYFGLWKTLQEIYWKETKWKFISKQFKIVFDTTPRLANSFIFISVEN